MDRYSDEGISGFLLWQAKPSVCIIEMIPGLPMRLRLPRSTECLVFDGSMQARDMHTPCVLYIPYAHTDGDRWVLGKWLRVSSSRW